jgi:hypothetical protein
VLKNIAECVDGDTFVYKDCVITIADYEVTSCSDLQVNAFTTIPQYYIYPNSKYVYGYTNGCYELFDKDLQVDVIHNLLELGEEKRNEIYSIRVKR